MSLISVDTQHNVVTPREVPYLTRDDAYNYMYGEQSPRRTINPDTLVYDQQGTGEVVGAQHIDTGEFVRRQYKTVHKTLSDGTIVQAVFTEHGAQLKSMSREKDGRSVEIYHQGTFAKYPDRKTRNPNSRIEDEARGQEPFCWVMIGADPQEIVWQGDDGEEIHPAFRMHGEAETSMFTFEAGLSDLENGIVVFSVKGEEMTGAVKHERVVTFVIHKLEDDGSVTTSVVVHNFSDQTIVAAPGFHPYHKRQYDKEQQLPGSREALEAVLIKGTDFYLEEIERLLLAETLSIATAEVIEYDVNGRIKGLKFVFQDDIHLEGLITPLIGFLGRDAHVWIWTDRANRYVCIEFTWAGEQSRGIAARDFVELAPGGEFHCAINRQFKASA